MKIEALTEDEIKAYLDNHVACFLTTCENPEHKTALRLIMTWAALRAQIEEVQDELHYLQTGQGHAHPSSTYLRRVLERIGWKE